MVQEDEDKDMQNASFKEAELITFLKSRKAKQQADLEQLNDRMRVWNELANDYFN